jgi:sulfur-oxidizing protein SoxX
MKFPFRLLATAVIGTLLLAGCRTYPDYSSDFRFPIQSGDVAQGRTAFVSLGCPQCHTVKGDELSGFTGTRFISLELGGELIFAKTYADIVTSIINPNHVISEKYLEQLPSVQRNRTNTSPMYMNPNMKVTELIDIVAYLNSKYSLLPGYTEYYY